MPFEIGQKYFIRTVTYFLTGEVTDIKGNFLVLKDAAWIADTGRFSNALSKGEFSEVEPVDTAVFVNVESVVDAYVWNHPLPRTQK